MTFPSFCPAKCNQAFQRSNCRPSTWSTATQQWDLWRCVQNWAVELSWFHLWLCWQILPSPSPSVSVSSIGGDNSIRVFTFPLATGKMLDATQEMLALGLCNIFGSFFMAMPTCGAFTRSAVSQASGVKTPFAGLYTGLIILLALSLLTPFFTYIPRATLASILCCAVAFMVSIYQLQYWCNWSTPLHSFQIDFGIAKKLWYSNKKDLFSWALCLSSALLFGVEIGLLVGISLSAFHLLVLWARPETKVKITDVDGIQYIRVTPIAGLYFSGIDYLRQKVTVASQRANYQVPVCIDCSKFTGLDYTSAQVGCELSTRWWDIVVKYSVICRDWRQLLRTWARIIRF